jgi:hypothetical protein
MTVALRPRFLGRPVELTDAINTGTTPMRRIPTLLALLAATLLLGGAVPGRYAAKAVPPGEMPSVSSLQFMAGPWHTKAGKDKGAITEEIWMAPRGGTMLGVNRVTKEHRTVFWEQLRIEERADDGIYYVASPMGRSPATEFRLAKLGSGYALFENPEHDWPQSIAYGLTDLEGQLEVIASGSQDGEQRVETWSFLRQQP